MGTNVETITDFIVEQAAIEFVKNTQKHFKDQRVNAGYEKEWLQDELCYFGKNADYYNGISKVRLSILTSHIERMVPKIDKILFPPDGNWFGAEPDNIANEVQRELGDESTALLKDQCRDINLRDKLIGEYRSLYIYGTVFQKTLWERTVIEKYKRNKDGKRVKDWKTTYDNPNIYSPSIWKIYCDIADEDMKGIVIEEIDKTYQELWEARERSDDKGGQEGIYRNVEKTRDWGNPKSKEMNEETSEGFKGLWDRNYGTHQHIVKIYECWGPIPKWFVTKSKEDKENHLTVEGMIVIAAQGSGDGAVLLRIADNPFDHQEKPYQRARYIKVDGRLYGKGLITDNISLEAYLNTLINQDVMCRTFNLRPKWLVDKEAKINPNALKDDYNQIIERSMGGSVEALRPNDFTGSTLAMMNFGVQLLEDGSGASKLLSGTPSGGSLDRTASGVATVVGGGLERLELVITTFQQELLIPMLNQMWALNQQFIDEAREVSVLGKKMAKVLPRNIPMPTINFLGIKDFANKNFMINQLDIALQNLTPYVQLGLDPIPVVLERLRIAGLGKLIPSIDKRPTSEELMEQTPEGEIQLLQMGRPVRVDLDDNHDIFIAAYNQLLATPDLPGNVRRNTEEALGKRRLARALRRNDDVLNELATRENIEAPNGF